MTSRRWNVITFPSWRREAGGAPGVPLATDGATGDGAAHGLDRPVWHEGDAASGEVIVRMRIDLLDVKPPIWRRLECRGSLTLDRAHSAFAAAFGWGRERDHRFRMVIRQPGIRRLSPPFANPWTPPGIKAGPEERTVPLDRILRAPRDRLRYTYGRGCDFTVVAEDVMPLPPASAGEVPDARCLAGRRAAPPEGTAAGIYHWVVSGIVGRDSSIARLFDLELPEGFDPALFDLEDADRRVRAAVEGAGF